ncbi:lytic polysaccharide monooxygenase [Streptomyces sp. NPDC001922]|uniref:lytic polysaccharide monooxygenase auxiliary activity family 9 protein n=1 Tax=Streptomyces sp. NPDC001922 TaxID=3364624 RepID=UPI0036932919
MRTRTRAAVVGLSLTGTLLLAAGSATGHGSPHLPVSRQVLCADGAVQDCGPIQWEPQSVEGPKGFPLRGPADGTICSGGNSRFAQLDDPRGGTWPATAVTAGERYTFSWRLTAPHATEDFRYYLTKPGYDPARPLTRSALETRPFLTVPFGGARPGTTVTHTGTLPSGRTGKQLIVGVWTIADTENAFYACSDVRFPG